MNTKQILSLAIIAALPLSAHATDPAVGPAHANSGAVVATANAPYVTQTPTANDATHIASTAYVKGAYNDAIAAVNNVANDVSGKQGKLMNMKSTPQAISNNVISSNVFSGLGRSAAGYALDSTPDGYAATVDDIEHNIVDLDTALPTTKTVLNWVYEAADTTKYALGEKQNKLNYVNNGSVHYMDDDVIFSGETTNLAQGLPSMTSQEFNGLMNDTVFDPEQTKTPDDILISAGAVFKLLHDMGVQLKSDTDSVGSQLSNKRVKVYTTWDDDRDSATTEVAFVNAQ